MDLKKKEKEFSLINHSSIRIGHSVIYIVIVSEWSAIQTSPPLTS